MQAEERVMVVEGPHQGKRGRVERQLARGRYLVRLVNGETVGFPSKALGEPRDGRWFRPLGAVEVAA